MTDKETDSIQRSLGRIEEKVDQSHVRLDKVDAKLDDATKDMAVLKTQVSEIRGADSAALASKKGAIVAVGAGGASIVAAIIHAALEAFKK